MHDRLIKMLKVHEGCKLKPYKCTAGKWTIGYGRNLDDVGISKEEAEELLKADIERAMKEVRKFDFLRDLNEVRKAVLIDMCFNMGISRLKGFKKTLDHVEHGRYSEAADEMLNSRWANQVQGRALRLAHLMRTGKWHD